MFMEVVVHLLLGFATCEALNDALHGPWVAGDGCCIWAKLGSHGLQVPPNKLHLSHSFIDSTMMHTLIRYIHIYIYVCVCTNYIIYINLNIFAKYIIYI